MYLVSAQSHSATCPAELVSCPHCNAQLARRDLSTHLSSICPDFPTTCNHSAFGCPWTGKRLLLSTTHLPWCPYEAVKGYLERQKLVNDQVARENEALRKQVSGLNSEVVWLRQQFGGAAGGG